jgi:Xaa-Pro aminopeptidase
MPKSKRLHKLREKLPEKRLDGIVISQPENRLYLSGFNGSAGYLIITENEAVLATDFRYTEQANSQAPGYEILRIKGNLNEWFPDLVKRLNIKRLGFESEQVTHEEYRRYRSALKKNDVPARFIAVSGVVEDIRTIKDTEEIRCIEKAVAICDEAYSRVESTIEPGMTEKQVAWELEKSLRENGSESLPFEIIVASGPNAALPHHQPSERIIREDEPVLIDMGARYNGYASDLSRTICTGRPDDTYRQVYGTVLDAQETAMSIIKEKMTGHAADNVARKIIIDAGYGEQFGHSLGHGIGLAAHELPHVSPGSKHRLTDGMVFTVEPGIYISGWGGVRIEDTAVMENGKTRAITRARKERYD